MTDASVQTAKVRSSVPILRACGLTKIYPGKVANLGVSLDVYEGEVHALLGENGAGKSTLVGMLSGMIECDEGEILWKGYAPLAHGAGGAAAHIGIVHQHFSLVPNFTLVENLMILERRSLLHPMLRRGRVKERIASLFEGYGFSIPVDTPMKNLSVGEQQIGELVKALYFDRDLLILDEPTAVLAPQHVERLWRIVRSLAGSGISVILIAHKISEVLEIADKVTVMRDGRVVATLPAADCAPAMLAEMMVGRPLKDVRASGSPEDAGSVLELDDVSDANVGSRAALKNVSLRIKKGEILGIAGIDGNGQGGLFRLLAENRVPDRGAVRFCGAGMRVGRIPEDRRRHGLVMDMSVRANLMLADACGREFSRFGFIRRRDWDARCAGLIAKFDIRCGGPDAAVRSLSGGNQQKLILARELSGAPDLLLVMNPTRGLDVGAVEMIHECLLAAAARGCAILLISSDLDEVLSLSSRVAVMHGGSIVGEAEGPDYDVGKIGLWMAGQEAA